MIPVILISIPLYTDIIRCFITGISFELKYESAVFISVSNFIIKTDNYILPISVMSPVNTLMKSSLTVLKFSLECFFFPCGSSSINYLTVLWKNTVLIFWFCLQNCLCTVAIYLKICDTIHTVNWMQVLQNSFSEAPEYFKFT